MLSFSTNFTFLNYGRINQPKRMNFRKSSEGGWGRVISNPKIYIADFCHYKRYFGHEFWKNCNMIFRKWERGIKGRSELFQKFIGYGALMRKAFPYPIISSSEICEFITTKTQKSCHTTVDKIKKILCCRHGHLKCCESWD